MAKRKVDVKAVAIELIRMSKSETTSKQISSVMATMGHTIAPTSVAALLAWHRS